MKDFGRILYKLDYCELGFCAYISAVLAELWCLEDTYKQFKLYVQIGTKCYFYDKAKGDNPWEYYFFQPTNNNLDLDKYIVEDRHPWHYINLGFKNGTFDYDETLYTKLQKLYTRYIKIKPHIYEKVNNFYNTNMKGKKVLGIQRRNLERSGHASSVMPPDYYFKIVDEQLYKGNYDKLYLVTDLDSVVVAFRNRYKDLLLHYDDALLSKDGIDICFNVAKENPYKVGEDVFVEALLLSKVDFLLAVSSNISKVAIINNDQLKYAFIDKHIQYN